MVWGLRIYKSYVLSLKHNHLQLQLRISRQWFTRMTLLNAQHLNFMGCAILLDNPTLRVSRIVKSPDENIFVYTYSYICKYDMAVLLASKLN